MSGLMGLLERVHAIVDALAGDAVGDDEGLGALALLLRQARGEAAEDGEGAGRLARLRGEWSEFSGRALGELEALRWVGAGSLRTRVGLGGDLVLVIGPGVDAEAKARHAEAVRAALARRARRLQQLTTIAVTASRIAALLAAPASMVSALPVAFACVREAHERGEGGGAPWQ